MDDRFTPAQMAELSHIIAWENCRARFNRGLDVPADGYTEESGS